MTKEEAKAQLGQLARARAFGCHVGSDRLIQAGLDALLADVDSPSLPSWPASRGETNPKHPSSSTKSSTNWGCPSHHRQTLRPRSGPTPAGWPGRSPTAASIRPPVPT